MSKFIVYQTELLYFVYKGIYLRTIYWSDGDITQEYIPKGRIIYVSIQ